MNAIELAEILEEGAKCGGRYTPKDMVNSAAMLREQAKEIEQLKEKNEAMRFHIVHGEHMPQMSDFL